MQSTGSTAPHTSVNVVVDGVTTRFTCCVCAQTLRVRSTLTSITLVSICVCWDGASLETCTCCQLLSTAVASTVFCLEQWQFCATVCGAASCAQQLLSAVFHTHSIFTTGKGVVQCVFC